MPSGYRIDVERRLVVIRVEGPVLGEEVVEARKRLAADEDFDPGFCQLVDLSGAEMGELTGGRLRQLARSSIFDSEARRALVAPADLAFGLSRMYQAVSEASVGQKTRVFRDMSEALEWLGVPPDAGPARPAGPDGSAEDG